MTRSIPLAFLAAALLSAAPVALDRTAVPGVSLATAEAASVDINVFFTSLAAYGSWVPSPNYNYVWVPTNVDADWSPYTNGHWIYTEQYGWYFASDEPFASIVYHYGRWGYDPLIGWFWVPGTNWAPAWVAWRQDNDDIGWAPLPPQGDGYATNINITINIGDVPDHYWRFVPNNQFLSPQLSTVAFAGDRRPDVFNASRPLGFVTVQNNVIINNVITLNFVEQKTNQQVTPTRIDIVNDPRQAGGSGKNGANGGNSINAFIASLSPPSKTETPAKIDKPADIQAPTKGQVNVQQDKSATVFSALTPSTGNLPGAGKGPNSNGGGPNGGNGSNGAGPGGANGPNGSGPTGGATTAPSSGQPGPGSANPRCSDPTFAKDNPKTCATSGSATATVNPNAGVTTNGSATTNGGAATTGGNGNSGKGPGNPTANGGTPSSNGTATTSTTNGKGPGGGTPSAGGGASTGGSANANANPGATATCADPTFAKNNPKTCGAQGNPGAGGPQGNNTTGRSGGNDGPTGNQTNNVGGNVPKTGGVGAGSNSPNTALGSATPIGNGGAQGAATANGGGGTCSNPAYAKANPNACGGQDGGSAAVTGRASGNGAVGDNGGANGSISVQGNAATTCADPTFAKNNPKACGPGPDAATNGKGSGGR